MQDVTMNDLLVVGGGTVALLLIFLAASYLMQGGTLDVWGLVRRYVAVRVMESSSGYDDDLQSNAMSEYTQATTTPQNSNNGIAITATERNTLLLHAKAEALATMIKAGKVGETEGIKIVFGVVASSSNPRYQAARAALKMALGVDNAYPNRTPEQKRAREVLGLDKHAA